MLHDLQLFPDKGIVFGNISKVIPLPNEQGYEIIVDIINENMIELDTKLFYKDLVREYVEYYPYFYFLKFKTNDKDYSVQDDIYLEFEITKLDKEVANVGEVIFINRKVKEIQYYEFKIKDKDSKNKKVKEYKKAKERIKNSAIDIDDTNKLELLNGIFKFKQNYNKINFRVHHVGQGHCSYLNFNRKSRGFYDVGYTRYVINDTSSKFNSFNNYKPKWIILSHWDSDHFLGVVNFIPKTCLSIPWITPASVNYTINSNRLIGLIAYFNGKLYLINNSFTGYNHNNMFYLLKGSGKPYNDNGLYITINNKKKMVSLGDLDYKHLPNNHPFYDVDIIVIPHHGSKQKTKCPFKCINSNSKFIVPVGYNTYKHPQPSETKALKVIGFQEHDTQKHGAFFDYI